MQFLELRESNNVVQVVEELMGGLAQAAQVILILKIRIIRKKFIEKKKLTYAIH